MNADAADRPTVQRAEVRSVAGHEDIALQSYCGREDRLIFLWKELYKLCSQSALPERRDVDRWQKLFQCVR